MSVAIKRSGRSYSYADYLTWPDEERWELIEGDAYAMSPAPSTDHQGILRELLIPISLFLRGKGCKVYPAPFDVCLTDNPKDEHSIKTVVQPDIAVICDPAKLSYKGCMGSPDWIIEIVSPGSIQQDYVRKLNLYEKYQVREYWIVHPTDKMVMVFKLNKEKAYGKPAVYADQDMIASGIFPEFTVDLKTIFTNI